MDAGGELREHQRRTTSPTTERTLTMALATVERPQRERVESVTTPDPWQSPCQSCRVQPATTVVRFHDGATFDVCGSCAP